MRYTDELGTNKNKTEMNARKLGELNVKRSNPDEGLILICQKLSQTEFRDCGDHFCEVQFVWCDMQWVSLVQAGSFAGNEYLRNPSRILVRVQKIRIQLS